MLVINDALVVNREYDFALRDIASCEDTESVDIRPPYDYISHRFRMPNARHQRRAQNFDDKRLADCESG